MGFLVKKIVYQGSKNRIAKYIVPIIQKYIDDNNIETYIEPFVGGANIIDKIQCKNKIGADINDELIALLKYVQKIQRFQLLQKFVQKNIIWMLEKTAKQEEANILKSTLP